MPVCPPVAAVLRAEAVLGPEGLASWPSDGEITEVTPVVILQRGSVGSLYR
jgi:hypothetical protein